MPRAPQDLVHQRKLDLTHAGASELAVQMRRPQPPGLHLFLERREQRVELLLREVVIEHVDRLDLFTHERAHPLECLFELRLGRKIPGHPVPLAPG